jgi:YihY family inner membrane protein
MFEPFPKGAGSKLLLSVSNTRVVGIDLDMSIVAELRRLSGRLDAWQQRHRATAFPCAVIRKFGDDGGGSLAALLAYYAFFSVFPLLMALDSITASVLHQNEQLRSRLLQSALSEFPLIGEQLRSNVGTIRGSVPVVAFGIGAAIWAGLAVLTSLQRAMDTVWDVPRRARAASLERLLRGAIALGALGLLVLAATATAGVATGLAPAAGLVLSAALNVATMAVIFRASTTARISWADVLPGALVAGLGWTFLQGSGAYVVDRYVRGASETYGTFAVVVGLLSWLYVGAQLSVLAAEVNVVRCRRLWPRSLLPPPTRPEDERALALQVRREEVLPSERISVTSGRDTPSDHPETNDS